MSPIVAPRVVFLDIDDTLYDHEASMVAHVEAVRVAFPDTLGRVPADKFLRMYWEGYARVPEAVKLRLLARDVQAYRRRVWAEVLGTLPEPAPDAGEVAAAFTRIRDAGLPAFPGAVDFVRRLAELLPVGVISNGPGDLQRRKLAALGVQPLVRQDLVFISHEVGWDKPDARIFRRALAAARVAPGSCLMVGDDPVRDLGAKAVGMQVALFCGKGNVPSCATEPDVVVRDYAELARVLRLDDA